MSKSSSTSLVTGDSTPGRSSKSPSSLASPSHAGGRKSIDPSAQTSTSPSPPAEPSTRTRSSSRPALVPPSAAQATPPRLRPPLPFVPPPPVAPRQLAYASSNPLPLRHPSPTHFRSRSLSVSSPPTSSSSPPVVQAGVGLARRSSYTRYPPRPPRAATSTLDPASVNERGPCTPMSSSRSPASTSPYPPFPPQQPHQYQDPRPLAPSGQRNRSRDALTPAAPPFPSHNSDPTVQTSRSSSGSSGNTSSSPGLFDRWGARLRTSSSAGQVGASSSSSNNKAGVGAPGSRVQAPNMSSGRPSSSGAVSAPPTPMSAPAAIPNGPGGQGWPTRLSAGRQQVTDLRLQGRHSFSEGQRPPTERNASQQQHEEELARVERESIRAEEERLRALAEQERQLRLTLAASAHTSEQDRLRAEELARAKLQEEEALRRAMADSRLADDEGQGVETEAQRKEREELELVMALSLSESRASMGRSKTVTSAQRFAELSRPSQEPRVEDGEWSAQEDRETRRRGKAREDSFATSFTTPHSLFNSPSEPQPSSEPPSRQPSDPSTVQRRPSSHVFALSNPEHPEEAPPAYVYPEHAPELDEADAVIFGPGRPVSSQPQASTSSAPPPPDRPPPTPPRMATSTANVHLHQSFLPSGPSPSHAHPPLSYYANSPTSFATPSNPPHVSPGQPPQSSYYSTAVAAALSPYDPSPQSQHAGGEPNDYFGVARRPRNSARDSFLSTASVAGSFESNDSFGSDRTTTTGWSGGAGGMGTSPGIVVEEPEDEEVVAVENPFDDAYSQGVAQPPREGSPIQQAAHPNDLFGMLRDRERQADTPPHQQPSAESFAEAVEPSGAIHVSWDTDSEADQEVQHVPVDDGGSGSTSPISPTSTVTSLDSAIRQEHQRHQVDGRSSLLPSPSPSTNTFATSHSSQSIASALTPSFGGFVSTAASNALADEHVLAGVKWGFVEEARKAMHPPLDHEGDFPRAAQLSRVGEDGGEGEFGCFAVEAKSWNGLLVYLMWHGNSRLEAAPADLQRDKANRGLSIAITLEFYLSFTDQRPRVRVRVDLLAASRSTATSPTSTSFNTDPAHPPNIFDPSCPSISLKLAQPALLPIPLSSLASLLSSAHTRSRKVSKQAGSAWSSAALPYTPASPLAPTRELAYAIDMTRRLNGEAREGDEETAEEAEAREGGLMERLKGRLKRRKKGPGIVKGGADGSEPGGRRLEGTDRLPEGANFITPFVLDERD